MKIAKLNIEGYIGGSDIQSMFSGEETFNLSKLKKFLDSLEPDVTDIHCYINSGGGSVNEGWAIYDKLKTSGKTVTSIGEGIVGSIATIIYMAGSIRKLHENTKFFIHNPYWMPDAPMPMEGNDLIALGEDLKNEQSKILDFYSKMTGTSIEDIEPLMNKATDLTSEQAIKMGFSNSPIITDFVNQNHYKLVAMVDFKNKQTNKTNKQMEENTNKLVQAMDKFGAILANVFKAAAPTEVKLKDGTSLFIVVDNEGKVNTGQAVYTDATMATPAVDGDYETADGLMVSVLGGTVAEVATAQEENQPMDALKAEIETLKAQLIAKESEVINANKEATEIKASLETINTEFVALKSMVIGAGAKFETPKQEFKNDKKVEVKESAFDHVAARLKRNN